MLDIIFVQKLLNNRTSPYIQRILKHFFETDPSHNIQKEDLQRVNRKLNCANAVLKAGEKIFQTDCSIDKQLFMLIKIQLDLYVHSYEQTLSNPNDKEWAEIKEFYRKKLYDIIRFP
jgi:hypothetical protein